MRKGEIAMQYHFKLYDDGDCIDEFDEDLYDDEDMKNFAHYILVQNDQHARIFIWDEYGRRYGYQLNQGKLKWVGRIGK
jgi:hypothetical protein